MRTQTLNLQTLYVGRELKRPYFRSTLDKATIAEYAAAKKAGAKFPPIQVYQVGNEFFTVDGIHRLEAARSLGLETIECEVTQGTIQTLHLDDLVLDQGTQIRLILDKETVSEYEEAIRTGAQFPPIDVYYDGENYYVVDGFHRVAGHRQAGKTSIECNIHEGTLRDAILAATGANARHGLRRSKEDKRRAVMTLLLDKEWQQWNDSEIVRATNTYNALVAKLRRELETKGTIPKQSQRK